MPALCPAADLRQEHRLVSPGCSTFFTHNTDGEPITCRNYDYPHRVSKEDRSLTGPDLEGFDISMMDILPYECMDGINDQGLCASVLRVDIKPGDQPAKLPVASSMLAVPKLL